MSTSCSPASTRCRHPVRCCSTTSSARRCWRPHSRRLPWRIWKSSARHGFSAAIHRPPSLKTTAGQPPSPTWPYRATNGNVGHTRRFRLMYPTHHAATLSRQSRPEALSAAAAAAFAAAFRHGCLPVSRAFTWGVALQVLMARRVFFLELLRAVRLRRDRRELSGAAFGEGRVALLQVLDEVQAAHAVVKATAHGLARADSLGRVGKA